MKKIISIAISLIMLATAVLAIPASAYASSMSVSCTKTIYSYNTTKLKIKIGTKSVSAKKCRLTSSNKSVATVSNSGTIKGVKAGYTTITATLRSNTKKKASIKVRVKTNNIKTPKDTIPFAKGSSNTLVIYYKGKRAGGGTVSFSSSNKNVATVTKDGKVKAIAPGTASIKVKLKSNTAMYRKIKINVIKGKSFSMTPDSAPLNGMFLNFNTTYNDKSNDYYAIRSYMEYFEKRGGGTLKLLKGEYKLCGTICIPSNTTIKLSDGVLIDKNNDTGTKSGAPGTGFMLCAPSKAGVSGAYSKYNGVHDVKLIGSGSATIDYSNAAKGRIGCTIVMCHNKNVSITGITFTDMQDGHFIEMDASSDVIVKDCVFKNSLDAEYNAPSECINLDTPDRQTDGFHQTWTSYDKTANRNVTISYCKFVNVQRGLGTHQYSGGKYHTNISVDHCTFTECFNGGIGMMNWKDSSITNNTFNGIGKDTKGNVLNTKFIEHVRGLYMAGCSNMVIEDNSFKNLFECIRLFPKENKGYPITYNHFSDEEIAAFANNNTYSGTHVDRPYVMVYADTVNGQSTNFQYKLELKKV